MRVNYAAANDYSVGNGMIAGAAIMNQPTGFVDPANGDFRLRPASHMVDKAVDGSNVMLDATDLAGNPRTVGPKRDLGAYEYQASAPGAVITGAGDVQAFRTLALSGSGSKDADPGDEVVAGAGPSATAPRRRVATCRTPGARRARTRSR
jgi:hypothetical protein